MKRVEGEGGRQGGREAGGAGGAGGGGGGEMMTLRCVAAGGLSDSGLSWSPGSLAPWKDSWWRSPLSAIRAPSR